MDKSMTDEEFRALAAKCHEGTASDAERDRFNRAYQLLLKRHETWDDQLMGDEALARATISQALFENVDRYQRRKKRFKLYRFASAAIVLLSIGISAYFYLYTPPKERTEQASVTVNDIEPGGNKAVLSLADGRKIELSGDKNGVIIQADKLIYNDGTNVEAAPSSTNNEGNNAALNTISIPQGGQYQIRLADGTHVWLNAASSLTYPSNFEGVKDRKVTLSGEAYFEVAKDDRHPFIVETDRQQVQVLGTHFNVYAYEEENVTKTTLLEGLVRVSLLPSLDNAVSTEEKKSGGRHVVKPTVLRPDQQSNLVSGSNKITVEDVDSEEAIAWQRGYFMFSNESLESVMNKVARWYDVKVVFHDPTLRQEVIYGSVSRSEKASGVLRKLALTGEVRFEIKDNLINVFRRI